MRYIFRKLRPDARGTATIELAMALPVLTVMALASIDFVLGFGYKMNLQQYAQSGADFVIANGENLPTDAQVSTEVAAVSGLDPAAISVTKWTECNQAKQSTYGSCPGASDNKANYMQIAVTDTYQPILAIEGIADFVPSTALTGTAVVRIPAP